MLYKIRLIGVFSHKIEMIGRIMAKIFSILESCFSFTLGLVLEPCVVEK